MVEGDLKPSSDTASHLYIYRQRPDVYGIVHTHSAYATAFAALGRPIAHSTEGLLVSGMLAERLDVDAGDTLRVEVTEGERPVRNLVVAGRVDDRDLAADWPLFAEDAKGKGILVLRFTYGRGQSDPSVGLATGRPHGRSDLNRQESNL